VFKIASISYIREHKPKKLWTLTGRVVQEKGVEGILKMKMAFAVVSLVMVVSLIFNVVMWKNTRNEQQQNNYIVYTQTAMNFRGELKTAAGSLDAPKSNLAVSLALHGASNDLEILNDPFSERGIPHVADISVKLANIESDFANPTRVSEEQLNKDKAYVEKAYSIFENTCYPNGQIKESAFPTAFAEIYSMSQ
jgi:hypothetical protein